MVDSPYWQGQGLAFLNSVTAGLYNVYLGEVEWTGLPVGKFSTVSYALSDDVLARVRGSYQDLKLTLVANVPSHSTGTYIFDAVRFVQQVNVQVQVLDSDSNPRPGLTVNVYSGANQTSYTGVTNSSGVAAIALPIGSYRFGVTDQGFTISTARTTPAQFPARVRLASSLSRDVSAYPALRVLAIHRVPAIRGPDDPAPHRSQLALDVASGWRM